MSQPTAPTMYEIRDFNPDDEPAVWELHQLGLQQFGVDLGDGPWDDDLRDIPNAYTQNRGEFLVACAGDRLIGMGGLRQVDGDVAEIKRMRVHPDFQRQGVGTAILQRLESTARKLGFNTIVLETTELQVPAQRFYRKHGFVEVARFRDEGPGIVKFRKHL